MKRIIIILASLAVITLVAAMAVNSITTGMTENAEGFFTAVRQGRMDTAYNHLSQGFKSTISPEELRTYLRRSDLDRYKAAAWDQRDYSGSTGTLAGIVFAEDGTAQPVRLTFIKPGDHWLIHSIDATLPGLARHQITKSVPELEDLSTMTKDTLTDFAHAVNAADFIPFHEQVSAMWQAKAKPGDMLLTFQPFVDSGADLTIYEQVEPAFSEPPVINAKGELVLKGYFPHEAGGMRFDMTYVFEYPAWKLSGLDLSIGL